MDRGKVIKRIERTLFIICIILIAWILINTSNQRIHEFVSICLIAIIVLSFSIVILYFPNLPLFENSNGGSKNTNQIGRKGFVTSIILLVWLLSPFQFSNKELNQIISFFAIWLIFLSLSIAFACYPRRIWVRIIGFLPFLLLTIFFPMMIFISLIGGGPITGYEVIDSKEFEHSIIVAYRTNGGATTSFGVEIVQEMTILPGIMLTKNFHSGYREYNATLEVIGKDSVLATIDDYPFKIKVRPFVYF